MNESVSEQSLTFPIPINTLYVILEMSTFNVVLSFCAVFCYLYRVVSYDT